MTALRDVTAWSEIGGTLYIYDGKRVIQERDTNNTPTVSYSRGNDLSGSLEGAGGIGGLLARTDTNGSTFYHADGNGNITYLVNSGQTLAASYRYDPFGNLLTSSGTLSTANTYRFSSKEYIPSVGIYYYLYRFYDPGAQRWLNRDPIMENGGLNLYSFCINEPIGLLDTDGRLLRRPPPGAQKPAPPVQTPAPKPTPGPASCPGLVSQWPAAAGGIGEIPDPEHGITVPGAVEICKKALCALAKRQCNLGCEDEYGLGAAEENPKCLKACKTDCNVNFKNHCN